MGVLLGCHKFLKSQFSKPCVCNCDFYFYQDMKLHIYKNQTALRCGYTTGSCATAAAQAAAIYLLTGRVPASIELDTPKGVRLSLYPQDARLEPNAAVCGIVKDSGDDPDVTNGIVIYAKVTCISNGIEITGGQGIGVVTKPGLAVPMGQAAINPAPRAQIKEALTKVAHENGYTGGFAVTIFAPQGEQIAKRTYNAHLGIINGISILGTSGIVEPMSETALIKTIHLEMDSLYMAGGQKILLCPGNYGTDFAKNTLGLELEKAVKCSNFIGEALDYAVWRGFKQIFLVGHAGKLVKIAAGIMNTHSAVADGRQEIFTAHAALYGARQETLQALMCATTVDACLAILDSVGLRDPVLQSVGRAIEQKLQHRVHEKVQIEYLMFTNQSGILAQSQNAAQFCEKFRGIL